MDSESKKAIGAACCFEEDTYLARVELHPETELESTQSDNEAHAKTEAAQAANHTAFASARAAAESTLWSAAKAAAYDMIAVPGAQADVLRERGEQAGLLRDIFNPFRRSPPIDPSLLKRNGGAISSAALAAYDDRELPSGNLKTDRLRAVVDALSAAGCTDTEVLSHLKSEGPHYRGCWALDAVLGKN
jgi:hypothetical protein